MFHFISYVSNAVRLHQELVRSAFNLLADGHTVPFIARYRAAKVGNVSAEQLYVLQNYYKTFETIEKTRSNRIEKLRQRSLLSPLIVKSFEECVTMDQLDDLWVPYKAEKKESELVKASSIEGLQDLAQELLSIKSAKKQLGDISMNTSENFPDFSPKKGLLVLLIHLITTDHKVRGSVKTFLSKNIQVTSNLKKQLSEEAKRCSKFRDYDNYSRRLHTIPHHQMLALRRGKEDEGELSVKVNVISETAIIALMYQILEGFQVDTKSNRLSVSLDDKNYKHFSETFCRADRHISFINRDRLVGEACCEALRGYLIKSISNEIYKEAVKSAEEKALNVFAVNLRRILMVPPLKDFYRQQSLRSTNSSPNINGHVICGIDPGMKHGHKIAIVNSNQELVARAVLKYSVDPDGSVTKLREICLSHGVNICSIGDGVGCLEAQEMVGKMLHTLKREGKVGKDSIGYVVVSEAGASVYSASKIATSEYPGVEITYLGAISIAQRLRNPLSELVKIQPASLGVGMYQRDLSEKAMDARLTEVVELCLNEVGVDVCNSSIHLMKMVSGLSNKQAEAILEAAKAGKIKCREDLMKIKGFGPVTFKNAAGFLKIIGGNNPLDNTSIHPEQYDTVHKVLKATGFSRKYGPLQHVHIDQGDSSLYECFKDVEDWNLVAQQVGADLATLMDLIGWLLSSNPYSTAMPTHKLEICEQRRMCEAGIPPEIKIDAPSSLRRDCIGQGSTKMEKYDKNGNKQSFCTGTIIVGTIRNITPFGAFVDLGIEGRMLGDKRFNTGLLHSSEVDLNTVTIGQSIEVVIKKIDQERGRVGLGIYTRSESANFSAQGGIEFEKPEVRKRSYNSSNDNKDGRNRGNCKTEGQRKKQKYHER